MTRLTVHMARDQVVAFYEWLLEDANFDRAVIDGGEADPDFTRERTIAALVNWRSFGPDVVGKISVSFPDDADAVFFRMKFT
jgi:hypothetical protein